MNTYNRYEISKIAVLDVFMLKENHQLSWADLAGIYHVVKGTDKENQLAAIIEDLTNKRILERLSMTTWKIVDVNKAQKALKEFIHGTGLQDLKPDKDLIKPATQIQSNQIDGPRRKSMLAVIIWIVGIIVAIAVIYKIFNR
jgi:hypothetical protein